MFDFCLRHRCKVICEPNLDTGDITFNFTFKGRGVKYTITQYELSSKNPQILEENMITWMHRYLINNEPLPEPPRFIKYAEADVNATNKLMKSIDELPSKCSEVSKGIRKEVIKSWLKDRGTYG